MKRIVILGVLVLLVITASTTLYTVDETEQAVVTLFEKPVGDPVTESGLHFKPPFFYRVHKLPKYLMEWDGDRGQIPTKDKTFIWIDVFARWKIEDPLTFFVKVRDVERAQHNMDGIIDPAVRNLITSNDLIECVRNTDRELPVSKVTLAMVGTDSTEGIDTISSVDVGRQEICDRIKEQADDKLSEFGIDLVDVRIKRINYVEEVLAKVYDRMIAERNQQAERFRSEGRADSANIIGNMKKEADRIMSEAKRTSKELRGSADGEATEIYANAYNRDPEFYSFMKTLDLYKETFDTTSRMILSTEDNDLLKYIKDYSRQR